MKNKLIILLLIILSFPCNAFDIESSWIDETSYKYITTKGSDLYYSEYITNNLLIKPDINYVYLPDFARSFEIKNMELEKNGTYLLELTFHYSKDLIGFDYDWNIQMKIIPIDEQRCHIILSGDDTENHTLYGLESVWYRTYSPSRIPIKNATINDTRVRLRVNPNLNSDTWALLDKGLSVKIKDKSKEKFEIDGESHYWYKVDNPNYPDGWVYGKYLDIEECAEEN